MSFEFVEVADMSTEADYEPKNIFLTGGAGERSCHFLSRGKESDEILCDDSRVELELKR